MEWPQGSTIRFKFEIYNQDWDLFDPTPDPVVTVARKGDGSAISPTPVLVHYGVGLYSYLHAGDVIGDWTIAVKVTDTASAAPSYRDTQSVQAVSSDPLTADVGDYTAPQAGFYIGEIADIRADTARIGSVTTVFIPLTTRGDIPVVRGKIYKNIYGNAVPFTAPSWFTGFTGTAELRVQLSRSEPMIKEAVLEGDMDGYVELGLDETNIDKDDYFYELVAIQAGGDEVTFQHGWYQVGNDVRNKTA